MEFDPSSSLPWGIDSFQDTLFESFEAVGLMGNMNNDAMGTSESYRVHYRRSSGPMNCPMNCSNK